ncbi:MAG: hypothetical protein MJE63_05730 [Proteobacteria bacterium]|nr:hypothetical protein [Pseudomonadota bacterium]
MQKETNLLTIVNQTKELKEISGYRLGTIVKMDLNKSLIWVDYADNPYTHPVLAKLGTPWIGSDELTMFKNKIDSVKIEFLEGNPAKPIIRDLFFSVNEMNRSDSKALEDKQVKVEADEIVLKGNKRIIIQCGETKTIFKADGSKIIQEADQITSSAQVTNKIKGGSISLN